MREVQRPIVCLQRLLLVMDGEDLKAGAEGDLRQGREVQQVPQHKELTCIPLSRMAMCCTMKATLPHMNTTVWTVTIHPGH